MAKLIAVCNITGPNGELVIANDPEAGSIPDDWPDWFLESLKEGGAIVEVEDADTVDEAIGEDEV